MQFSKVHIFGWSLGLSQIQTCADQSATEMTKGFLQSITSKAKCFLQSHSKEEEQWVECKEPETKPEGSIKEREVWKE